MSKDIVSKDEFVTSTNALFFLSK